jgi:hypothetical protein
MLKISVRFLSKICSNLEELHQDIRHAEIVQSPNKGLNNFTE